jgi:hypothetical protein
VTNATEIAEACARAGIEAGRAIRTAIHDMPLAERARPCSSALKAANVRADQVGEDIGLRRLERLAAAVGLRIHVLLDFAGAFLPCGPPSGDVIWAAVDAIDGTKKVAGIEPYDAKRLAAANDGCWAATMAFTLPTRKSFGELTVGDFCIAALVDGNPPRYETYPPEVIALLDEGENLRAFDVSGGRRRRVFTTSTTALAQGWAYFDAFQAFDRETRAPGDEELAIEVYRGLINRHEGGAYDVVRQFGSLSALQRSMLGWREAPLWYESQGVAFVVINENLPNLIPAVAAVEGAGGLSLDFEGRPVRQRRLRDGRTSVAHVANAAVGEQVLRLIAAARSASR